MAEENIVAPPEKKPRRKIYDLEYKKLLVERIAKARAVMLANYAKRKQGIAVLGKEKVVVVPKCTIPQAICAVLMLGKMSTPELAGCLDLSQSTITAIKQNRTKKAKLAWQVCKTLSEMSYKIEQRL